MSNSTIQSSCSVQLIQTTGTDQTICQAARVSTLGAESLGTDESAGLINFLMKNRHGSPFEHGLMTFRISAPIFVWREFMRHRIGFCLPGSAQIPVGTQKNGTTKSIEKIYKDWKIGVEDSIGRVRKLESPKHLMTRTLNLDTGLMEYARMVDVYQSGIKPIIGIELASGHFLRCTEDHRVLTSEGWVRAGDLDAHSLVARMGKVVTGDPIGIPHRLREGIQFWTSEQKKVLIKAVDYCVECENRFPYEDLHMDHNIPVAEDLTKALDTNNLVARCRDCHRSKTNFEQKLSRRRRQVIGARYERVINIYPDGEEMTYDISMPPPWHNFVADGVIVHNSYNEESGRYKEFEPLSYIPDADRALVQIGKAGAYSFVKGTPEQYEITVNELCKSYDQAWSSYSAMLDAGIAKEVARVCLPLATYSTAYVTCNPRSLMSFLSLRTNHEDASIPSYPQHEISQVADKMEVIFSTLFQTTHKAFNQNGRVAP